MSQLNPFSVAGPTFGLDTSQNYKTWGNVEPVTLTAPSLTAPRSYTIPIAKRRNPTFKEQAPSGGVYGGALMTWLLPQTLLAAAGATGQDAPRAGWTITDAASTVWVIQQAPFNALRSTWVCTSLNLFLVFQLQDLLTVQRPALTLDAASGRTYPPSGYTVVYSNVPCRFQLEEDNLLEERGKALTVSRYRVPVMYQPSPGVIAPLVLSREDQIIRQSDGKVMELKRSYDATRIDELQKLECEVRW